MKEEVEDWGKGEERKKRWGIKMKKQLGEEALGTSPLVEKTKDGVCNECTCHLSTILTKCFLQTTDLTQTTQTKMGQIRRNTASGARTGGASGESVFALQSRDKSWIKT